MSDIISVSEYRALIRVAVPSTVDAETDAPDLQQLYTPDGHRRALEPDVTIVRGARGAGKTFWYKSLQDETLRRTAAESYELPALTRLRPLQGFGSARTTQQPYPSPAVIEQLLAHGHDPHHIWLAVLLKGLGDGAGAAGSTWLERLHHVTTAPESVDIALARADEECTRRGETILIMFDALDRLHKKRSDADFITRGILRLGLDLRLSTRNVRAKIFIRPDMLESSALDFTDSSKLISNLADITWSNTNLYGLFFHRLGNSTSSFAQAFRTLTGRAWRQMGSGQRFIAPDHVAADRATQQQLFVEIAGPYMGTNHRKGHTYPWLPNHLMDGAEQVSPRSFLSALAKAAELTADSFSGYERPLHYDAIRSGVQHASRIRVQEVKEDIPWAAQLVGALEGMQVPIERDDIRSRWSTSDVVGQLRDASEPSSATAEVKTGPRSIDPDDLIDELVELGVMSLRRDGRVDLPDVYRIAFRIGRKGGVPKVTR